MDTAQIVTTLISIAAFGVAAYGIIERRVAARRAERIRLTTIAEDLTKVRFELLELIAKGETVGDFVEALNARLEVLSQQALSLVQQHSLTVTSTECREIAFCLHQAGYPEDAEFMWDMARERAQKEGDNQVLFANRGYAYYLFRAQREMEARKVLREALSAYQVNNDDQRLQRLQTLKQWVIFELQIGDPDGGMIPELTKEIDELGREFSTPGGKANFMNALKGLDIRTIESPKP